MNQAPSAMNPRDAYFLGFLPSVVGKTVFNYALVDQVVARATGEAKLEQACKFSRQSIKTFEVEMYASYNRLVELAQQLAITVLPMPIGSEYESWAEKLLAASHAAAGSERAAFDAGTAAGDVHFAIWVASNLIYLRSSSPSNTFLKEETGQIARKLDAATARLFTALDGLGEGAQVEGNAIRVLLRKTPAITTILYADGIQHYFKWATALEKHLPALGHALDRPAEAQVTGPPTAEERVVLGEILAHPEDDAPRNRYAELAARRNDPRTELIRVQMLLRDLRRGGPMGMDEINNMKRAAQLIRQHTEWSDPVLRLGAQAAQFRRGFVDEIKIDAGRFLATAPELYEIAPILHVRFTGAKGKVADLTVSPHLARLRSISLVENQLSDEDVATLAAAPTLANLRWLDLSWNHITNRGVEALAASPHLAALQYLGITSNPCDNPVDESDFLDETTQYWKYRPAGEALEAKVGHKIEWLHPGSERWPPDVEMV